MTNIPENERMAIEEAAIAAGNRLEPFDGECPRGVKNPGLYYGAKLGWEEASQYYALEISHLLFALDDATESLKEAQTELEKLKLENQRLLEDFIKRCNGAKQ